MARPKNNVNTLQITLSVTEAIKDMLDKLASTGYYGKNSSETATLLLGEKLRDLCLHPTLPGVGAVLAELSRAKPAPVPDA